MKTLILFFLILIFYKNSECQIFQDYPFKTFLDADNNLYVTGNEFNVNTKDIFIRKISQSTNSGDSWKTQIPNPFGDDNGVDLIVDGQGNVFVTGFMYSNITNSNKIVVISLNSDGTENWIKYIDYNNEDKGMGIDITKNGNGYATEVFITGYITNPITGKDFIVKKLDARNGDSLLQTTYPYPGDQVATDILLDAGYAYVVGYTYAAGDNKSDIMIQSYDKLNGGLHDNHVFLKPGSNERPTGFCIPFPSGDPISKSRSAITSITDSYGINNSRASSYFTICFDPDLNNDLVPKWSNTISSGSSSGINVPTAITNDNSGDIYVTGYMRNPRMGINGDRGFDFATVKYKGGTGVPAWEKGGIIYNNYNDTSTTGVDDKATSVKVNNKKRIYIAGTSQGSPNGYSIAVIDQPGQNPNPVEKFKKSFIPNFLNEGRSSDNLNKWSTLELTSDGTPVMIVMGWNENEAHWAAVKYDSLGNEEYTINNDPVASNNKITKNSEKQKLISIKNYPNPFNPTTNLEFGISGPGFVTLKVYDMMGQEVSTLVNETKTPGSHSVRFDGSDLSSGVYYYTISVDGIRMETKSMVLMK